MSVTASRMVPGVVLILGNELQFTADADKAYIIQQATLTNVSGAAVDVSIWLPPSGGGQTPEYEFLFSPAAGATLACSQLCGHVVPPGGTIYARDSVGGVVSLMISGAEVA